MLKRFFTPKWQHKNPAVRQRAIASISDEETLIRIANTDSHTEVCETAIRQISSIGTLLKSHHRINCRQHSMSNFLN